MPSQSGSPYERTGRSPMRFPFMVLLALFAGYAALFVGRMSFEIGGVRFFCLFDDAMISMRYAKNLAAGAGLVWNTGGERVEGFTNPLWVLFMAGFHFLPISMAKVSLWIQASEAISLVLTIVMVRKISLLLFPGSRLAEYVPAIMTAFYFPLLNWSLQGMEVGPLALLLTWSVWLAMKGLQEAHVPSLLYWILGTSTLLRLDVLPLAVVLLATLVVVDPEHRRRHMFLGGSILLFFLVVQTAGRSLYYGELLPNTYFLKVSGVPILSRLQRGSMAFLGFVSSMTWFVFLFPFILFLLARTRGITLLAVLFLTQCAYSISVGGDVWEWWGGSNRYITVVMPMFFILFGGTLARLAIVCEPFFARSSRLIRYLGVAGTALIVLASLAQLNSVKGAASAADWLSGGKYLVSTGFSESGTVFSWLLMPEPLECSENIRMIEAAMMLDSITSPGARVAVVRAGAMPYFSARAFVDLLGKNDKTIARVASRATLDPMGKMGHTPGHSKWSYAYSLGECKPDVIYELWAAPEEARPFLEADYDAVMIQNHSWYVRRGSASVRWNTLYSFVPFPHKGKDGNQGISTILPSCTSPDSTRR